MDVVVAGGKAPLTSGSYLAARSFVRAVSGHRLGLMLGWLPGIPADDDDDDAPAASRQHPLLQPLVSLAFIVICAQEHHEHRPANPLNAWMDIDVLRFTGTADYY
ncbi:hypothetical protein DER46DRAFT_569136 [Fusarium sp. MPI-SDFR-AT-0072]|nr:hypothetical protein DER46DRAFT_569136 [Fusarium sp. MPI-SDFR-AT-0072]